MDFLVEFFPLLIFVVYAILRALSARKRPQQTGPESPNGELATQPGRPETSLEDLTRHLESLMGMEPERTPSPPPEPRYEPEFHSSEAPVDESAGFQHDAHGFGYQNPLSEQSFESLPAFAGAPRRDRSKKHDPHRLKKSAAPPKPTSKWTKRLASPSRAREAFVLKTIFERPGGRGR